MVDFGKLHRTTVVLEKDSTQHTRLGLKKRLMARQSGYQKRTGIRAWCRAQKASTHGMQYLSLAPEYYSMVVLGNLLGLF